MAVAGEVIKILVRGELEWLGGVRWQVGLFGMEVWGYELFGKLSWRFFSVVSCDNINWDAKGFN